jgi:hypothetical protein
MYPGFDTNLMLNDQLLPYFETNLKFERPYELHKGRNRIVFVPFAPYKGTKIDMSRQL